jgi:hypothetical protein
VGVFYRSVLFGSCLDLVQESYGTGRGSSVVSAVADWFRSPAIRMATSRRSKRRNYYR